MEATEPTKARLARTATALILALGVLVSVATSEPSKTYHTGTMTDSVSMLPGQDRLLAEAFMFGDWRPENVSLSMDIYVTYASEEPLAEQQNDTWTVTVLDQPEIDVFVYTMTNGEVIQTPEWEICHFDGLPVDPDIAADTPCLHCPEFGSCLIQVLLDRAGSDSEEVIVDVDLNVTRLSEPPAEFDWFLLNLVMNSL
jgi:hypothetical protein